MSDAPPEAANEVSYYLACFPAPPLRLDPERPTTIGRAEENTIVLADSVVSRRHAAVEWRAGDFVVRDLGSRNGILVNGSRVGEAVLRSDDQIRIGDRVFTFLAGEELAVSQHFVQQRRRRQAGGTDIIEAASLARPAGGFSGRLEDFDLAELLQALGLGSKTGRVRVACEDVEGDIYVCEGQVVKAALGGLSSEDAVYSLLALRRGTFEFEAGPVDVEPDVLGSTASLLMEALRRVDEERRARAEAAGAPASPEGATVEPHDPSLDTKHGEEPPPEVEAASHGETMTVRRRPEDAADADTDAAPAPQAEAAGATHEDTHEDSRDASHEGSHDDLQDEPREGLHDDLQDEPREDLHDDSHADAPEAPDDDAAPE